MEQLQAYANQKEMIEKTFSPEMAAGMLQQLEREFSASISTQAPQEQTPVVEQPTSQIHTPQRPVPAEFNGSTTTQPKYSEEILSNGIHSGKTRDMVAAWREAGKAVNNGQEVRHTI